MPVVVEPNGYSKNLITRIEKVLLSPGNKMIYLIIIPIILYCATSFIKRFVPEYKKEIIQDQIKDIHDDIDYNEDYIRRFAKISKYPESLAFELMEHKRKQKNLYFQISKKEDELKKIDQSNYPRTIVGLMKIVYHIFLISLIIYTIGIIYFYFIKKRPKS